MHLHKSLSTCLGSGCPQTNECGINSEGNLWLSNIQSFASRSSNSMKVLSRPFKGKNTLGKQKSILIGCQSSLPLVTLSPCQAQQASRSCKSFDDCDIFETNNDTTFLLPTLITLLYDGSAASCFSSWEKGSQRSILFEERRICPTRLLC